MQFEKLEDKCLYYRGLTDYKILPNVPILAMVDGRSFSRLIKNKFKKPFDEDFIDMMNNVALALCENVQGVKCAYVQSDEITLLLDDSIEGDVFFSGRLCKMNSIIASIASSKFQTEMTERQVAEEDSDIMGAIRNMPLYQFDCKVWNVPNRNDAYAWFLYRQIECIRNSKQQAAQAYLSHNTLLNLSADDQIALLKIKENIDWENYEDGEKYGRFIVKQMKHNVKYVEALKQTVEFDRPTWTVIPAFPLMFDNNKQKFLELVPALRKNG